MFSIHNRKFFLGGFLILVISLISFTWFDRDLVYSFGDFTFNFSPKNNIEQFLYIWNEKISTGVANFQNFPNLFPYQVFLYVWDVLDLPLYLCQRILFWLLFLLSGWSMYFLVLTLTRHKKKICWATISGLFYMMNPFSLVLIWGVLNKPVFFYAFLPLLLALYIKLIEERQSAFRYIFLFVFVSLFATTAFSVLTYAANLWFLVFVYLFFYIFFGEGVRSLKSRSLLITLILFIFWFSVNAFWFISYQSRADYLVATMQEEKATSPIGILKGASRHAQLSNTFRLFGYNVFREKFMGIDPFYPYAQTYFTPFFVFGGFLIPLLVFLPLLLFDKNDESRERFYLLFFTFFSLLSLLFFKGINKPFGEIYLWLAGRSPFFALAYRNPIDKIGLLTALSFSVLFGYSISWIFHYLKEKRRKIFFLLPTGVLIIYFFVYLFPFWQGQVFYKGGKIYRSSLVKVPDYYWEATGWLRNQRENFRIFPVPLTDMYGLPLQWENGYDAGNPLFLIFDKPIFFLGEKDSLSRKIWSILNGKDKLSEEDIKNLKYLLSVTQTKYFLVHNDIAEDYFSINKISYKRVKKNIEDNFLKVASFGKLDFYQSGGNIGLPIIFITEEEISSDSASLNKFSEPAVKRINPTRWEVEIKQFKKPFSLVFLTSFSSGWKVFLRSQPEPKDFLGKVIETFGQEPLPETAHFLAYGYANAWKIENSEQNEGLDRLVIEYVPQRLFYLGAVISLLALIVLTFAALAELIVTKRRSYGY